jgi:hypothetical protein
MEHDVDYCTKQVETIDQLGREVDSLRLTALAALEELDQLLTKNKALAESNRWSVQNMQVLLDEIVGTLRRQI